MKSLIDFIKKIFYNIYKIKKEKIFMKGYAIAKIEYGGWGDSHPVVKGALFKIFPTRAQHGYPEYGIINVDIYPGEYELKE